MEERSATLDINQIKEYLPHRYPMLLVDRVLHWESGKSITAIKNVTANEEFFNGHFPNKPVMPGVLMIEAMAQAAALLSFLTAEVKPDEKTLVYFLGIDNARFKRPVEPGDQLKLEAEIVMVKRGIWKYKARATVDGQVAVEADMMCTIRTVDNEKVTESENISIGSK
jgi:3-hydroxyacyl-[acyl-carrier-protein] dehydratase